MAEQPDDVHFEFDGRRIAARPGQTLAGALHSNGEHVLSRSFKYHRPRGLFCMTGRCPNCLCTVDGTPNVRICTQPAKTGMVVKSQNAWPSLKRDLLGIFDRLHRFMPVGFYYKQMYKPRWAWPYWEKFIRRVAGLGSIDRAHGEDGLYDKVNLFTDVAVVGGGVAGLNAALAAAEAGATVTLIDEQPALGGHLRHDPDLSGAGKPLSELIGKVTKHKSIQVFTSAVAFGCYEGNYLGIQQGKRMIRLRAAQVVIAAGAWERPLIFENNDLPGVLLASGAQRLVHLEGCQLGGAAVIVTDNAQGYRAARQLAAAGTQIAAIVDLRESAPDSFAGVPTHHGWTVHAAHGKDFVVDAVIASLDGDQRHVIPCRWIIEAVGFTPANSLLYQNGCKLEYDASYDHAVVKTHAEGMHSAGAVNGLQSSDAAALDGRRAGLEAAAALSTAEADTASKLADIKKQLATTSAPVSPCSRHYCSASTEKKKFVCLCEDVTEKDICDAIAEGYSNIETLKRYSTVSMGPCQGKMCQSASIALCARENGVSIVETGVTTARPPEHPLPLGVLAGRTPHFSIVRRTPMHAWHERNGATMMDAGAWKRPQLYISVEQEYDAVRNRAGLIDVSTLGKLELRGRDVVKFLEFVYPNRFENLKVGRVRYGVICDDAGIILDDGTISRLGDDRYFLTTTTGNAD
ncbi:MAG: (2Fe-2S)-binding protein, partial [Planctomycetaceae bacterium]|nr:(2Fe-2S)-binding protein [Planctomycetaceae bacterium]